MKRIPPSEVMKQEANAVLEGYLEEGPPLEALARLGARYMLQVALEEVTAFLGRGHYQHGFRPRGDPGLPHARAGWRNGYQPVALRGPDGKWELFRPKVRATKEPFRSAWARRIRLGREDLQALVAGMSLQDPCGIRPGPLHPGHPRPLHSGLWPAGALQEPDEPHRR